MHLSRADCDRLGIDWDTGRLTGTRFAASQILRSDPPQEAWPVLPPPDPLAIVLAGHPPTVNQLTRGKLKTRIRLGKCWRAAVREAWRGPRAQGKRRVRLTIVLGPQCHGADVDAFWKSALDALVLCGALWDDSKEWAELAPVVYERGPRAMTRIVLEEV